MPAAWRAAASFGPMPWIRRKSSAVVGGGGAVRRRHGDRLRLDRGCRGVRRAPPRRLGAGTRPARSPRPPAPLGRGGRLGSATGGRRAVRRRGDSTRRPPASPARRRPDGLGRLGLDLGRRGLGVVDPLGVGVGRRQDGGVGGQGGGGRGSVVLGRGRLLGDRGGRGNLVHDGRRPLVVDGGGGGGADLGGCGRPGHPPRWAPSGWRPPAGRAAPTRPRGPPAGPGSGSAIARKSTARQTSLLCT